MGVKYFQEKHVGIPLYNCRRCERRTRETGEGESDVQLCAHCYNVCNLENIMSDSQPESFDYKEASAGLAEMTAFSKAALLAVADAWVGLALEAMDASKRGDTEAGRRAAGYRERARGALDAARKTATVE